MIDFKKIDEMVDFIEQGTLPENKTFNQFAVEFYLSTKTIPLSKYLKTKNRTSKVPKIMNTKKAGEVIFYSEKDDEIKVFLSRRGFKIIPELNYTSVMLLRKVDLFVNWQKLITYFEGAATVQEINNSLKPMLLPGEVEKLEKFVKTELKINDQEFNWLLDKFIKIENNKSIIKSLKKLAR
ncbi:MAG: hypothetical protein RR191_02595 [Cetobacterium sp.]|uniref:hypothetical protein n=1 Tax=unclassified Cetobacterium TaxID=2630983 RepID=UPI00163C0FC6|nr:hypothetical protein [Cetobacterium sp. 2A]MBC2856775.1 hypothetical protein [Cetobacterium sp. 2A]